MGRMNVPTHHSKGNVGEGVCHAKENVGESWVRTPASSVEVSSGKVHESACPLVGEFGGECSEVLAKRS